MPKVAILYSGHVGGKRQNTPSRGNGIDDGTTGLETWDVCRTNQEAVLGAADRYFYTYTKPENTSYKQFVQIPQSYYREPHPAVLFCNSYTFNYVFPINVLNNWHNGFIGFDLVPSTYDVYIKSRCDIVLSAQERVSKSMSLEQYKQLPYNEAASHDTLDLNAYEIKPNVIYVTRSFSESLLNDQFAIGDYETMRKYFEVYLHYRVSMNDGFRFHAETMLYLHLERQGITTVQLDFSNLLIRAQ
jgi:hypothetical protein